MAKTYKGVLPPGFELRVSRLQERHANHFTTAAYISPPSSQELNMTPPTGPTAYLSSYTTQQNTRTSEWTKLNAVQNSLIFVYFPALEVLE